MLFKKFAVENMCCDSGHFSKMVVADTCQKLQIYSGGSADSEINYEFLKALIEVTVIHLKTTLRSQPNAVV